MRKSRWLIASVLILLLVCANLSGCSTKSKKVEDGSYEVAVSLEGGTGRAHLEPYATIVADSGELTATVIFSSSNYDYMVVDGVKYINEAESGPSTFSFPIKEVPSQIDVCADTTAMSVPHEINYTITFGKIE